MAWASTVSARNYVKIVNGQEWPIDFVPFCRNAARCPWNNPLPDNAAPMPNSASMIYSIFGSGGGMTGLPDATIAGGSSVDFGRPVYLASATDPQVALGSGCGVEAGTIGSRIHIPARARATNSSDHTLGVIQPNGDEWDFWDTTQNGSYSYADWKNGDTVGCQYSGSHSNIVRDNGSLLHSATSGGALSAGTLRYNEVENGVIPHALYVVVPTELVRKDYIVYPGQSGSGKGGSIPIGARVQLKWTDAQIDAMPNQAAWEKVLLHQLHDYGIYILDCGGDGAITYKWESPTQYTSFGGTNPGTAWAKINKPPSIWKPAGINWATDLQIVAPCYAEGTCGSHRRK